MEFIQFIELLSKAANYTGYVDREERSLMASVPQGIACQMHLTADGHVSAEQTGIVVSFNIFPKA